MKNLSKVANEIEWSFILNSQALALKINSCVNSKMNGNSSDHSVWNFWLIWLKFRGLKLMHRKKKKEPSSKSCGLNVSDWRPKNYNELTSN